MKFSAFSLERLLPGKSTTSLGWSASQAGPSKLREDLCLDPGCPRWSCSGAWTGSAERRGLVQVAPSENAEVCELEHGNFVLLQRSIPVES